MQETPQTQTEHTESQPAKKSSRAIIAILIIVIVACLGGAAFGFSQMAQQTPKIEDAQNEEAVIPATPDSSSAASKALEKNPIDFEKLREQNEDIYAWIYVPNTNVNYAILRHPSDNAFYLTHDAMGADDIWGAIFTEDYNTTDFNDGVTLVYGHNGDEGQMFGTLHYFEDEQFFKDNDTFYIYAPGHIYTYRIVSAFTTDDQHVLYRYGYFQTYDELREFESEILDPHSIQQNVRDVELDDDSKIVVLSTCNTGALEDNGRYLVCGVLTDDQPTD